MKSRMIVHEIELYRRKLIIIDSRSQKYIQNRLTNVEFDDEEIFAHAVMDLYDGWMSVFIIVDSTHKQFHPCVITHEAVHCANMIFQYIGHIPDANNDEPQAYLTEWIFEKAYNFIYDESAK